MQRALDKLQFDDKGLIPAIVQDAVSGKVLMLAYMSQDSLAKTIETGNTWFYSRSRQSLWNKGATSGNTQSVVDIRFDCDSDALLILVHQKGVACHTGEYSCFSESLNATKPPVTADASILQEVFEVIMERKKTKAENSYVFKKMQEGIDRIIKKIGEEAGEVIIAAKNADPEEMASEMADLIFHCWLTLGFYDLSPNIIYQKLLDRRK